MDASRSARPELIGGLQRQSVGVALDVHLWRLSMVFKGMDLSASAHCWALMFFNVFNKIIFIILQIMCKFIPFCFLE